MASLRRDPYSDITKTIIDAIEANPGKPELPWRRLSSSLPMNALGRPYSGINTLILWAAAQAGGFRSNCWATYAQWQALGAQVRKGERSTSAVFFKNYEAKPDPDDAEDDGKRRVMRTYALFSADQVEGWREPAPPPVASPAERLAHVDAFITATGAAVRFDGGEQAFYDRNADRVHMPSLELFTGTSTMTATEAYHAVHLHELVHWSGAKHRLDRQFGQRFGDEAYAAEELVAEIGSAFLCAGLGISQAVRPDHAKYLASWLKLLKSDRKAIFTAAAKASEAVRFLQAFSSATMEVAGIADPAQDEVIFPGRPSGREDASAAGKAA